jgi:hypothetical protein
MWKLLYLRLPCRFRELSPLKGCFVRWLKVWIAHRSDRRPSPGRCSDVWKEPGTKSSLKLLPSVPVLLENTMATSLDYWVGCGNTILLRTYLYLWDLQKTSKYCNSTRHSTADWTFSSPSYLQATVFLRSQLNWSIGVIEHTKIARAHCNRSSGLLSFARGASGADIS